MQTIPTSIATILLGVSYLMAAEEKVVSIEPLTVKWKHGEIATPKALRIKTLGKERIRGLRVSSKCGRFKFQVEEVVSGREYKVTVTPDGTRTPVLEVLHIETIPLAKPRMDHAFMFVAPERKK